MGQCFERDHTQNFRECFVMFGLLYMLAVTLLSYELNLITGTYGQKKNSTYRNQYPLWFWHSHLEIQPHEFGGSCLCIPCLLLKIKINTHMKMYMIPKVPSYRTVMVLRLVLTVSVTIYNP